MAYGKIQYKRCFFLSDCFPIVSQSVTKPLTARLAPLGRQKVKINIKRRLYKYTSQSLINPQRAKQARGYTKRKQSLKIIHSAPTC